MTPEDRALIQELRVALDGLTLVVSKDMQTRRDAEFFVYDAVRDLSHQVSKYIGILIKEQNS